MAKARSEAQSILADGKAAAEKVKDDIIAKSKEQANKIREDAGNQIQVEKDTKSKLHIYDLKGQEVATFNVQLQKSIMNHYKINFSDFPSGIFFINIQSSEFSVMKKITLLK